MMDHQDYEEYYTENHEKAPKADHESDHAVDHEENNEGDYKNNHKNDHGKNESEISRELLENVFEGIPPATIVEGVNPGSQAIHRIMAGVILNAITLEFLELNYILPAIGMLLLLLGFRTLRKENLWFRIAYICSLIRMIVMAGYLIINATIYDTFLEDTTGTWIMIGSWVTFLAMLFAFWKATDMLQEKAAIQEKSHCAASLFGWYLALLIIELIGFGGTITLVVMIVVFIKIILSIDHLAALIETENYLIQAAPVKIGDGLLAAVISGTILIGMTCGYLFFSGYPMKWTQTELTSNHSGETYDQLLALGYPKDQLDDLTTEEIEKLKNADQVLISSYEEEICTEGAGALFIPVGEKNEMKITSVAVRLTGNGTNMGQWRIIHHFSVDDALIGRGTSNICIDPLLYDTVVEDVSGRMLCRKNGTDLTADFVSLGFGSYTWSEDLLDIHWPQEDIQGDFSLPAKAENRRGYAAYTITQTYPDTNGFCLTFTYTGSFTTYS